MSSAAMVLCSTKVVDKAAEPTEAFKIPAHS